jgi:hypothetical protein
MSIIDLLSICAVSAVPVLIGAVLARRWGDAGVLPSLIIGPLLFGIAAFVYETLTAGSRPPPRHVAYTGTPLAVLMAVVACTFYWLPTSAPGRVDRASVACKRPATASVTPRRQAWNGLSLTGKSLEQCAAGAFSWA